MWQHYSTMSDLESVAIATSEKTLRVDSGYSAPTKGDTEQDNDGSWCEVYVSDNTCDDVDEIRPRDMLDSIIFHGILELRTPAGVLAYDFSGPDDASVCELSRVTWPSGAAAAAMTTALSPSSGMGPSSRMTSSLTNPPVGLTSAPQHRPRASVSRKFPGEHRRFTSDFLSVLA